MANIMRDENDFLIEKEGGVIRGSHKLEFLSVRIPEEVEGIKVKEIDSGVFLSAGISRIELPEGLEIIKPSAFMNNYFAVVEFPSTITRIGKSAFSGNHLAYLEIPEGLRIIEERSFARNNGLNRVELPDSVKVIKELAFLECNLKTIIIGSDVDIDSHEKTMGYHHGFKDFYDKQGRKAGEYYWRNGTWRKERVLGIKDCSDKEMVETFIQERKDMIQDYKALLEDTGCLAVVNKSKTSEVKLGRTLTNKVKEMLEGCVDALEEDLDRMVEEYGE